MGAMQEVRVPDIGDFKDVDVIEILVKPGDTVAAEQSLISLESDKATMEIPSPSAGVVRELRVKVGDKVSEGTPILVLEDGPETGFRAGTRRRACRSGAHRGEQARACRRYAPRRRARRTDRAAGR
jgi:pyruvate/2-oxoglutarate dehydrogenase complex dihydrolipoamide acyltransferase (E2) component